MSESTAALPDLASRRPQRADAQRNFDALLAAAREAFAENGTNASLEDIARRAGVGIGTLYRHFPHREDLFQAVYVGGVEDLCTLAADASDLPPWDAFVRWTEGFVGFVATKVALKEAMGRDEQMFSSCRAAMLGAAEPLFTRAQDAGEIRADASFDDVLRMLSGIIAAAYVSDEQRGRVLEMALDGIRTRSGA
jgi:AcrR family transcriptional regulator